MKSNADNVGTILTDSVAEVPEPQWQEAVLLPGSLLTEALAIENGCEDRLSPPLMNGWSTFDNHAPHPTYRVC